MAGTQSGGVKAAQANRERYGEDFYTRLGAKGGSVRGRKGFAAMNPDKVIAAGRKGGSRTRNG